LQSALRVPQSHPLDAVGGRHELPEPIDKRSFQHAESTT
jgi:hypothetical protein